MIIEKKIIMQDFMGKIQYIFKMGLDGFMRCMENYRIMLRKVKYINWLGVLMMLMPVLLNKKMENMEI